MQENYGGVVELNKHETKPVLLANALDRLGDTCNAARQLLEQINGATPWTFPVANTGKVQGVPPALSAVLSNSPDRIHDHCEQMNKILQEIRETLF